MGEGGVMKGQERVVSWALVYESPCRQNRFLWCIIWQLDMRRPPRALSLAGHSTWTKLGPVSWRAGAGLGLR